MNKLAVIFVLVFIFMELSIEANMDNSANSFIDSIDIEFISRDSLRQVISRLKIAQYNYGKKDSLWYILEITDLWRYMPHPTKDTLVLGNNIHKKLGWFYNRPDSIHDTILLEAFIRKNEFDCRVPLSRESYGFKYSGSIFSPQEGDTINGMDICYSNNDHRYDFHDIEPSYENKLSSMLIWYFRLFYFYVFIYFMFYNWLPAFFCVWLSILKEDIQIKMEYVRRGIYIFGALLSVFLALILSRMANSFSWFDIICVSIILLSCLFLSYWFENNKSPAYQEVLGQALVFSPVFFICYIMGVTQALLFLILALVVASPGIILRLRRNNKEVLAKKNK